MHWAVTAQCTMLCHNSDCLGIPLCVRKYVCSKYVFPIPYLTSYNLYKHISVCLLLLLFFDYILTISFWHSLALPPAEFQDACIIADVLEVRLPPPAVRLLRVYRAPTPALPPLLYAWHWWLQCLPLNRCFWSGSDSSSHWLPTASAAPFCWPTRRRVSSSVHWAITAKHTQVLCRANVCLDKFLCKFYKPFRAINVTATLIWWTAIGSFVHCELL